MLIIPDASHYSMKNACVSYDNDCVIYGGYVECDDNSENQVTLVFIHSLLTQMNSKLSDTEIKNDSLETRLSETESKIVLITEIQGSLETFNNQENAIVSGLRNARNYSKELESNVSALGNVFDSIKEVPENNKHLCKEQQQGRHSHIGYGLEKTRRHGVQRTQGSKRGQREHERVSVSLTDIRARSMRDNLILQE